MIYVLYTHKIEEKIIIYVYLHNNNNQYTNGNSKRISV